MSSIDSLGGYIVQHGFARVCVEVSLGIGSFVAVAVLARTAFSWISWREDQREHHQEMLTRFQRITATLLTGGVLVTALSLITIIGTDLSLAMAGLVLGGIWLGVGAAVYINYRVFVGTTQYDGGGLLF